MSRVECIPEADLKKFAVGDLPEREAQLVALHLETCPDCEARASRWDGLSDAAIQALRGQGTAEVPSTLAHLIGAATASQPLPALTELPSPDGYTLLEELGRGAASVVYKARQHHPERIVALKYLLAGPHAAAWQKARFLAEADAIARLDHPHIVRVFAVGEHQGHPFLCLEFVPGGSLAGTVQGRPLPAPAAARLVQQLAQAVGHAHSMGIVHRDLKPANVLLVSPDFPKVTDFGLARFDRPELTATGMVLGTPAYMAPEQAQGQNQDVGPAADIYALGTIFYELLTGQPPFRAATILETVQQTIHEDPRPPASLNPAIPRDLETICLKCLQKNPTGRYQSALALADDLDRFLHGLPIRARPVGATERTWRWVRRHPGRAAMLAALAAVAIGTSVLSVSLSQALTRSDEEKINAQQAEKRANEELWQTSLAEARARRLSNRVGQRLDSLAAIRRALQLPVPPGHALDELRNEAIASLVLPDLRFDGKALTFPAGTRAWAVNLHWARYARADAQGNVTICRLSDDQVLARLPGLKEPLAWYGLQISEDGRLVVQLSSSGLLRIWNIAGVAPALAMKVHLESGAFRAWLSPDGKRVAIAGGRAGILVYRLSAGPITPAAPWKQLHTACVPRNLAFHPHGHLLAISSGQHARVLRIDTGEVLADLQHPAPVDSVQWHPDGNILATSSDDLQIRFWDVTTRSLVRQPLIGHTRAGVDLMFARRGEFLVSSDWSSLSRVWDVRTGRQLFTLPGGCRGGDRRSGRLAIALSELEIQFWSISAGAGLTCEATPFPGPSAGIQSLHPGPGEGYFVVTTGESLQLRDWTTGEIIHQVPANKIHAIGLAGDQAVLTAGAHGVQRWPIQADPGTRRWTLGRPKTLVQSMTADQFGVSADGQTIAIPNYHLGALVWHVGTNQWTTLGPREDVRYCAISPNGRWVATGNHYNLEGIGATVWDMRARPPRPVNLPVGWYCAVGFSPDNHWLLTRGGGFRLWEVGSWKPGPDLMDESNATGYFAFSSDGKTLALTGSTGQIRLLETETGREFARLTVPEQTRVYPYFFSPDGTKLAAVGSESQLIYLWDLRVLRLVLARDFGLDWHGSE